eukprot:1196075-Prorocentrum_minimum.AAC.6
MENRSPDIVIRLAISISAPALLKRSGVFPSRVDGVISRTTGDLLSNLHTPPDREPSCSVWGVSQTTDASKGPR